MRRIALRFSALAFRFSRLAMGVLALLCGWIERRIYWWTRNKPETRIERWLRRSKLYLLSRYSERNLG